jgi:hypothetical protein
VSLITAVVSRLAQPRSHILLDLRRHQSLHARALSRLGWACEVDETKTSQAGEHHRLALELEPANPYYLANMLGFELRGGARVNDLLGCMRPLMLDAIRACESHAAQQIELPFAYFTAGRLRLLLGEAEAALQDYLRGTHHCLDERNCAGCEVLDDERAWLHRIHYGRPLSQHARQARDFLLLARAAKNCAKGTDPTSPSIPAARKVLVGPVLVIAGGAVSIPGGILDACREPLTEALRPFKGTVISGGTRSGVPGLVGEIAETLKRSNDKRFELIWRARVAPASFSVRGVAASPAIAPIRFSAHWAASSGSGSGSMTTTRLSPARLLRQRASSKPFRPRPQMTEWFDQVPMRNSMISRRNRAQRMASVAPNNVSTPNQRPTSIQRFQPFSKCGVCRMSICAA